MKRKSLIIRIPKGCEEMRIIKEYVLDDEISLQIVVDDTFEETDTCVQESSKVFFCYQDRVKTRFNPYDYSYIEAVGNHCVRWMPIDRSKPTIAISVRSLGDLLSQMNKFGIHEKSAACSASWGLFQIMGFNYAVCGCSNAREFVNRMMESEGAQLDLFVGFLKGNGWDKYLRALDWTGFARHYNGPQYAQNKYDEKLQKAYLKYLR